MIRIRPGRERGHADHGWLDTYHTFSFADYYDPEHMGFRSLRVINEDRVEPGQGFGTHPHRDMEIITYVLEGALEHKDSLGTGSVIRPGDVQRMSAGTGITHSEFNHLRTELVHFLQIWILPERKGLKPGYEQKTFSAQDKRGQLRLLAARNGHNGTVAVHQDMALYAALLSPGEKVTHSLERGRHAWLQVVRGAVTLNGEKLKAGDGAAISEEQSLEIEAAERIGHLDHSAATSEEHTWPAVSRGLIEQTIEGAETYLKEFERHFTKQVIDGWFAPSPGGWEALLTALAKARAYDRLEEQERIPPNTFRDLGNLDGVE